MKKLVFPFLVLSTAFVAGCADRYSIPELPATLMSPAEVGAIDDASSAKTHTAKGAVLEHYDPFARSHKDYREVFHFDTGKHELSVKDKESLDALVKRSEKFSDFEFVVTGHTDRHGKESANDVLSQKRADAVLAYLWEKQVPHSKIVVKAVSERKLAVIGTSKYGDRKNRRVEVELYYIPDASPVR